MPITSLPLDPGQLSRERGPARCTCASACAPSHVRNCLCLAQLSFLGVTEDSFYRTANSQHFQDTQWRKWVAQRAFVALYIASHRGNLEAVQYLLEHGNSGRAQDVQEGGFGVPIVAQRLQTQLVSTPGLAQWVKDPALLWCRSQMWLESCVAVAVV